MRRLITITLWLFSVVYALANGGGYSYGIEFTGGIRPFEPKGVENISIEEETLDIFLHAKHADVEVRYRMKNAGSKQKVRFGFPVESPKPIWHTVEETLEQPAAFGNYQVVIAGKKVKSVWRSVVANAAEKARRLHGLSGWMVSDYTFPKEKELLVQIRYRVEHSGSNMGISDDSMISARKFDYRFSTGAVWKGAIRKGQVTVRLGEGLKKGDVNFLQPTERFEWMDGTWVWDFKNFEPTLVDDLKIEIGEDVEVRSFYGDRKKYQISSWIRKGAVWSEEHSKYEVKASSTLPAHKDYSYEAANVKSWRNNEENETNCWAEGAKGSGAGEWLEFTPTETRILTGFHVAGGLWKKELFEDNARPKLVTILLNEEYSFQATLPDEQSWEDWIWIPNYHKPVKKVRMTFNEVYQGKRFEDLCISRVTFLAKLAKEPKFQGAR